MNEEEQEYLEMYFDIMFMLKSTVLGGIKKFSNLQGYSYGEGVHCRFSPSLKGTEDEIPDNTVLVGFDFPAVDEEVNVVISYEDFFDTMKRYYTDYAASNPDCADRINEFLIKAEPLYKVDNKRQL